MCTESAFLKSVEVTSKVIVHVQNVKRLSKSKILIRRFRNGAESKRQDNDGEVPVLKSTSLDYVTWANGKAEVILRLCAWVWVKARRGASTYSSRCLLFMYPIHRLYSNIINQAIAKSYKNLDNIYFDSC